jgi:predicted amidophosphoribosyltransferase
MSGEAGKGSTYRAVNLKRFNENWDNIFSKSPDCPGCNPELDWDDAHPLCNKCTDEYHKSMEVDSELVCRRLIK